MKTLLITRSQVEALIHPSDVAQALREAFAQYSRSDGLRAQRVRSDLPGPGTATILFPGLVPGRPVYTVKVHAKFPERRPAIRGVLCLFASDSGELLAIMDSTHITALRTGLIGAMAADVLANSAADTVAVIGAGVQGRQQLVSLASLRRLRSVSVYDTDPNVGQQFAAEVGRRLGVAIRPALSVDEAVHDAGIVLIATWAREPLILPGMLAAGSHVTTLGADEPGKVEVSRSVIESSLFFCDDADLAAEMGALAGAGLSKERVAAELGEVLAGSHPGRTSPDQVTIYGGVGLAFQDAVCAWSVYEAARERDIGTEVDFLS